MRRLFIVLAKIAGLLQLYWTLANFLQVGYPLFHMFEQSVAGVPNTYYIGMVLYFVLLFGMSWVLIARTEWLADRLKIREDGEICKIDAQSVLLVGVKLIGLYVLVSAIPRLANSLSQLTLPLFDENEYRSNLLHSLKYITPVLLQLALGFFLAFKPETVVKIISGKKKMPEAKSDSAIS
jgi:hypothetical protein